MRSIREFTEPTNLTELRGFLGACNWMRRFYPMIADMAEPLNRMTKSDKRTGKPRPFAEAWGPDQISAFEKLRFVAPGAVAGDRQAAGHV